MNIYQENIPLMKEGREFFLKLVKDKYEAESNKHLKSHSNVNMLGEV